MIIPGGVHRADSWECHTVQWQESCLFGATCFAASASRNLRRLSRVESGPDGGSISAGRRCSSNQDFLKFRIIFKKLWQ